MNMIDNNNNLYLILQICEQNVMVWQWCVCVSSFAAYTSERLLCVNIHPAKPIDSDVIRIRCVFVFFCSLSCIWMALKYHSISYIHNWYCSSAEWVSVCVCVGRQAQAERASIFFIIHCWLVIKLFAIFGRRRRCCRHRYFQCCSSAMRICFFIVMFLWCHEIHTSLFSELLSWLIKFAVPFISANNKIPRGRRNSVLVFHCF